MKKKILIIAGVAIAVIIAAILCFIFFGHGERTLEEITSAKAGGGCLRYTVDNYTTVEISFTSHSKNGDEREGTCFVSKNYYKKASYSASGKVFDHCDTQEIPCSFTDYSLTLNGIDHYTYKVIQFNGSEYVEFSKPFMGQTSWYINK